MVLSQTQNAMNCVIMLAVALPAILVSNFVFNGCDPNSFSPLDSISDGLEMLDFTLDGVERFTCTVGLYHPIVFVNIVFFMNVCILFWFISLLQGSTWLIDPYWTIIPPMISLYYQMHPLARSDDGRAWVVTGLVLVWSLRLTHSYFRREGWQFGAREDWDSRICAERTPSTGGG